MEDFAPPIRRLFDLFERSCYIRQLCVLGGNGDLSSDWNCVASSRELIVTHETREINALNRSCRIVHFWSHGLASDH